MPLVSARVVSLIQPGTSQAFANAGEDQSVLCASIIQLQGEIIGDDPALHTFEWEQTSGTPVTLINANTLFPTFVNPNLSDIEFTLYVDRGTPFETFDTVFISRRPASTVKGGMYPGTTPGRTSVPINATNAVVQGVYGSSTLNSVSKQSDVDFRTAAYSYNYPPDHTYSPIYKAEDLRRIKNNLAGKYWLMRDIDMSDLETAWEPLGTSRRPFSGELQGNGFSIDGLTIDSTTILGYAQAPVLPDVTTLTTTDSLTTSGDITSFPNSITWTPDGLNCIITRDSRTIYWYSASSAFDFNTLTEISTVIPNITASARFTGAVWNDDGTKVFFADYNGNQVVRYDVSTPYDLTTIAGTVGDQTLATSILALGLWFSLDGTYLYVGAGGATGGVIDNWLLSTPFDLSTASFVSTVDTSGTGLGEGRPDGVIVGGSGERLWFVQPSGGTPADDEIIQVDMSTAHDLSTGSITGKFKVNDPGLIWLVDITWEQGSPGDVWLAYTAGSRTLRKVSGDIGDTGTVELTAGLFSHIGNGAVIENVGITNASISGVSDGVYKGILAGSAQGPSSDDGGTVTIRDCYVSGTVDSGGDLAGGLIGHTGTNVSSLFENTYADVTVTGGGTNTGAWAGNFQTEGTYNDNFWDSDKTTAGVGTGGDTPIAGEVDSLTTAQLQVQSNYTNWDFDAIWQMPDLKDNIGPAQLQNDIFDRVANEGTQLIAGQQQGATWNRQALSGYRAYKTAEMRGVIIQDQNPATTAWENTRFIPVEQDSAIMAPGRRHRLFTVFGIGAEMRQGIPGGPKLREVTYLEPSTIVPKTTTDSNVFAGATSPVSAIYPGNMVGDTITSITITNPSKITKLVEDTVLSPFASQEPSTIIPSITRNIGAVFTQEDTILFAMSPGGGSVGYTTASITRNNGASIGT